MYSFVYTLYYCILFVYILCISKCIYKCLNNTCTKIKQYLTQHIYIYKWFIVSYIIWWVLCCKYVSICMCNIMYKMFKTKSTINKNMIIVKKSLERKGIFVSINYQF